MFDAFKGRKAARTTTNFTNRDLSLHFADKEGPDPYFTYHNGNKHASKRIDRKDCANYFNSLCDHMLLKEHADEYIIPPPPLPPRGSSSSNASENSQDSQILVQHQNIIQGFKAKLSDEIAERKAEAARLRAKKAGVEAEIVAKAAVKKQRAAANKLKQQEEQAAKAKLSPAPQSSAEIDTDQAAAASAYDRDRDDHGGDNGGDADDSVFSAEPSSNSSLVHSLDDVSLSPMKKAKSSSSNKSFIVPDDYESGDSDDDELNRGKRVKTVNGATVNKAGSSKDHTSTSTAVVEGKKRKKRDSNLELEYLQALSSMASSAGAELGHTHPAVEAMDELQRAAKLGSIVMNFSHDLVQHITVLLVESTVFEQKFTQFYLDQRYYLRPAENGLDLGILQALDFVQKQGTQQMATLSKLIKDKLDADAAARLRIASDDEVAIAAYKDELRKNIVSYEAFRRATRDKFRNICRATSSKMLRHWALMDDNSGAFPVRPPPNRAVFESRFALAYGQHSVTAGRTVNAETDFSKSVGDVEGQESIPATVCALLDLLNRTHPISTGLGMALLAKVASRVKKTENLPASVASVQNVLAKETAVDLVTVATASAAVAPSVALHLPAGTSTLSVPGGATSCRTFVPASTIVDVDVETAEHMNMSLLSVRLQKLASHVFADASASNDVLALCMHNRRQTLRSDAVIKLLAFALRTVASSPDVNDFVQKLVESEHAKVFECAFLIPFSLEDRNNTGANGYCFPRSYFQAKRRALSGFKMPFARCVEADRCLYDDTEDDRVARIALHKDLQELRRKLHYLDSNSGVDMSDDVRRVDGMVYCFRAKADEPLYDEFWGKLDWLPLMGCNVTGFSHTLSYPGLPSDKLWARFWNSTLIRQEQHIHDAGGVTTVAEIRKIISVPANNVVFHINHFFVVDAPEQPRVEESFMEALGGLFGTVIDRIKCFSEPHTLLMLVEAYLDKTDTAVALMSEHEMFLQQCVLTQEVQHAKEQNMSEEKERVAPMVLLGGLEEELYERTVITPLTAQEKIVKIKELQKKTDTLQRKVCMRKLFVYLLYLTFRLHRTRNWNASWLVCA